MAHFLKILLKCHFSREIFTDCSIESKCEKKDYNHCLSHLYCLIFSLNPTPKMHSDYILPGSNNNLLIFRYHPDFFLPLVSLSSFFSYILCNISLIILCIKSFIYLKYLEWFLFSCLDTLTNKILGLRNSSIY